MHIMELCSHHQVAVELHLPTQKGTHGILVKKSRSIIVYMTFFNKCVLFKGWISIHAYTTHFLGFT